MARKTAIALIFLAMALTAVYGRDAYKCNSCEFADRNCRKPEKYDVSTEICSVNDIGCYTIYYGRKAKRGCLRSQETLMALLREGSLTNICEGDKCNSNRRQK